MNRMLVVDDEENIRQIIRKYALHEGFQVDEASNGAEAVDLCRQNEYSIVIMDIMMPVMNGFDSVSRIREFSGVPVIMLSARGEEYDRIKGFELGIDDYVVKPFSAKELMLRVSAIIKRTNGLESREGHEIYLRNGLEIDFTSRTVSIDGVPCDMSPKEYELLFYLVKNRRIALTRDKLLCEIWGYDFYGDDRTLDTHIKLVRKKLGRYNGCIVTLRGVGYRFEEPQD